MATSDAHIALYIDMISSRRRLPFHASPSLKNAYFIEALSYITMYIDWPEHSIGRASSHGRLLDMFFYDAPMKMPYADGLTAAIATTPMRMSN